MDKPVVIIPNSYMDEAFSLAKAAFKELGKDMADPKNIETCKKFSRALFTCYLNREASDRNVKWVWEQDFDEPDDRGLIARIETALTTAHSANEYDEPDNIDDDCGFDPYMGCFSDDC